MHKDTIAKHTNDQQLNSVAVGIIQSYAPQTKTSRALYWLFIYFVHDRFPPLLGQLRVLSVFR